MVYIVGFVAAVPAANKDAYLKHATDAVPVFRKYGVTRMVETWGDDVPRGEKTDFYRAVDAQQGEVVAFAFQEYPDRETAEAADKAMMDDPAMAEIGETMPFDGKRMIWGGFEPISDVTGDGDAGYFEGSLIAVPTAQKQAYATYADTLAALFVEYGAVRSLDAWGAMIPDGDVTDLKKATAARNDETVVFGWIAWPSKQARDDAWPKIMQDPRMEAAGNPDIDESRRLFGGFMPILQA